MKFLVGDSCTHPVLCLLDSRLRYDMWILTYEFRVRIPQSVSSFASSEICASSLILILSTADLRYPRLFRAFPELNSTRNIIAKACMDVMRRYESGERYFRASFMKPSLIVAASTMFRPSGPCASISSRLQAMAHMALTRGAEQWLFCLVSKSFLNADSLKSMWTGCTHVK